MTITTHKMQVRDLNRGGAGARQRSWPSSRKPTSRTRRLASLRDGMESMPNQLFAWRKLASQGALTAAAAEEEVVPVSEYRALQNQVKEL